MKHSLTLRIGPVGFRIGSAWRGPIDALAALYEGYPAPEDGICDFTVRLEPEKPWRRWLRPSVAIQGDYVLPDAAPMALAHGLIAPVLSYFANEMHLGYALPMMASTMGFSVLVVIFVLLGPETRGKEMTADLEVFQPAE